MNVRKLKTGDFFRVASILGKLTASAVKEMESLGENPTASQVGALFIAHALRYAEADIMSWMADLIGVTPEEFDEMSFETPMLIFEELTAQEDMKSFFQRVAALAKTAQS